MPLRRTLRYGLALVLLIGLLGCEDNPTGVGLTIDRFSENDGDPVQVTVAADSLAATSFNDLVGNRGTVLVGLAEVPGAYEFSATAYTDLLSTSRTDDFREGTVEHAVLYLEPSYVFGDSLSPVEFEVFALDEELETGGATNDTTIAINGSAIAIDAVNGSPVADNRVSFLPTDTLVAITLGTSWIGEYDAALRSEEFADDFHGFAFAPVEGAGTNTIVGLDALGIELEVAAAGDTVRFPAGRLVSAQLGTASNFTKFERLGDYVPTGADPYIVQDGVGTTFTFDVDLPDSLIGGSALNRGTLTLQADTLLLEPPVVDFAQSQLERFYLLGASDGETGGDLLGESAINADGDLVFSTRTSSELYAYLRAVLLGEQEPYETYKLVVPGTVNTVDYQVFRPAAGGTSVASLELTVVPLD